MQCLIFNFSVILQHSNYHGRITIDNSKCHDTYTIKPFNTIHYTIEYAVEYASTPLKCVKASTKTPTAKTHTQNPEACNRLPTLQGHRSTWLLPAGCRQVGEQPGSLYTLCKEWKGLCRTGPTGGEGRCDENLPVGGWKRE